jgi:hypothetical protein
MKEKNAYFDGDAWNLAAVDSEPITSLSELKTGVYSIQLLMERVACGPSTGPGKIIPIDGIDIYHTFTILYTSP